MTRGVADDFTWCLQMISWLSPALQGSTSDLAFSQPLSQGPAAGMPPFTFASLPWPEALGCHSSGPGEPRRGAGLGRLGSTGGAGGHGLAQQPSVSSHAPHTSTQPAHAPCVCDVGWQLSLGFPSSPPPAGI